MPGTNGRYYIADTARAAWHGRGDSLMSNHFHLVVTGQVEDAENTNSRVYELESSRTQSFPNGPDGGAFRVGPEKRTGKERRVRPTASLDTTRHRGNS